MNRIEFEKKWLNTFIPNLTNKQYNDCFIDQYLWHIFSYELIPKENVLTGDMARKAYENINKENAIMIQIWDDEVDERTTVLLDEYKNWKEIEDIPELFVVDKDWKLTYVSTHENGWCGPYFYKIS